MRDFYRSPLQAKTLKVLPTLQPHQYLWFHIVKFLEDKTIALLALLLLSPVMLVAALLIKLDSPGPVFFRQKRGGVNGSTFTIYKFRTMSVEAGKNDRAAHATPDDPRKTRIGNFLRRTSIDELPQLLNVLKGDMSIIGPRPHMLYHDELYRKVIRRYDDRFRVKPGLTGLAQVEGHRGMIYTNDDMQKRVDCDNYYIDHWSLRSDILILMRTVWVVLKSTNAH